MTARNFHKEHSKTTRLYQGGLVCTFDEMMDFAEAYHAHKKKYPATAMEFYEEEVKSNFGKQYMGQYQEFISLICGGFIPSEGILRIKKQLSYEQFEKVLLKASSQGKRLSDLMNAMANDSKYTKGKKSLFLTLNSWLNRN